MIRISTLTTIVLLGLAGVARSQPPAPGIRFLPAVTEPAAQPLSLANNFSPPAGNTESIAPARLPLAHRNNFAWKIWKVLR